MADGHSVLSVGPVKRRSLCDQWVPYAEVSFHPKRSEACTLFHELAYAADIGNATRSGAALIISPQNSYLFAPKRIEEER